MENMKRAIELIENTDAVFAAVGERKVITSDKRGISALMGYISENLSFDNMSVADRVVGKAAAMLMVKLNIKRVYAKIISAHALKVFEKNGTEILFGEKTEYIINRTGDGMCPMEQTVLECDDVDTAYEMLFEKLKEMGGKR